MRNLRNWIIGFMVLVFALAAAQAQVRVKEGDKPIGSVTATGDLSYRIEVEKTGVVVRLDLGQSVPAGTLAWVGTGRQPGAVRAFCSANPGVCQQPFHMWCGGGKNAEVCRQVQDVSISCHNAANQPFCSSLAWVHRESDGEMNKGTPWADDAVLLDSLAGKTIDPALAENIRKCTYRPATFAVVCDVVVKPEQKGTGRFQSHFSAVDSTGVVYAGYQPQRVKAGSHPVQVYQDDGQGNPHQVIGTGTQQPRLDQPSTEAIGFAPATPASAPKK